MCDFDETCERGFAVLDEHTCARQELEKMVEENKSLRRELNLERLRSEASSAGLDVHVVSGVVVTSSDGDTIKDGDRFLSWSDLENRLCSRIEWLDYVAGLGEG